MAQGACVHPGVDLSQIGLSKKIVGGQLVNAKGDSFCCNYLAA